VSVSITEALVILLLVAWMTQLASGRLARPTGSPLVAAVGGLVVALAFSTVVATDLNLAAKELLKWIELAAVCLAGASLLDTPRPPSTAVTSLWPPPSPRPPTPVPPPRPGPAAPSGWPRPPSPPRC